MRSATTMSRSQSLIMVVKFTSAKASLIAFVELDRGDKGRRHFQDRGRDVQCGRAEAKRVRTVIRRCPTFRIGIHGGDVVVSERGDTERSIGI
jgi:class 3 adenylate cyclase